MTAPRPDLAGRTRAPEFLTPAEVADHFRVAKSTVYRLVAAGRLPHVRIGHTMRIPAQSVADYLARQDNR